MNILGNPETSLGRIALFLVSQPFSIGLWEEGNQVTFYCLPLENVRSYTGTKIFDAFKTHTKKARNILSPINSLQNK